MRIHKIFQSSDNLYIFTDYCNQGTLDSLIKKQKRLDENTAIMILRHLVVGLCFLDRKDIMHRDLKPSNILLLNGVPKICDFGFCCM